MASNINAQSDPIPPSSRTKDEEFWFYDGTIILVVEGVEFRISKGLLTEHSHIFRDMFSLPSTGATSDDEYVGSCPVVHLPSDATRDWRHVLRLYMPRRDTRSAAVFLRISCHTHVEPASSHRILPPRPSTPSPRTSACHTSTK